MPRVTILILRIVKSKICKGVRSTIDAEAIDRQLSLSRGKVITSVDPWGWVRVWSVGVEDQ